MLFYKFKQSIRSQLDIQLYERKALYVTQQMMFYQNYQIYINLHNIMKKSLQKDGKKKKTQQKEQQPQSINEKIQKLAKLFKKCTKQNLQMGDQGQTYQDFLQMKGIQPNQEGTGRISFSDITKIQLLYIKSNSNNKSNNKIRKSIFAKISKLLHAYLLIDVEIAEYELQIDGNSIIDRQKGLQYDITRQNGSFDALQLLDLLTQYKVQQKQLVALIQNSLFQQGSQVYGRACGNGVAVIDLTLLYASDKESQLIFLQTCLHETLHTLGFDHCIAYTCLMNPLIAKQIWLCPCCMKKLWSQLSQGIQAKEAEALQHQTEKGKIKDAKEKKANNENEGKVQGIGQWARSVGQIAKLLFGNRKGMAQRVDQIVDNLRQQ